MLKPSYSDLIEKLNKNSTDEDKPIITSRYSIVIAAAKRAREIVDKNNPLIEIKTNKPVSIAVEELYQGKTIIKNKDNKTSPIDEIEDINEIDEEIEKDTDNIEDIENIEE